MANRVDARGLSCPEPVLLARRALSSTKGEPIEVLVDTVTSCENVARMARSLGCDVEVSDGDAGELSVRIAPPGTS